MELKLILLVSIVSLISYIYGYMRGFGYGFGTCANQFHDKYSSKIADEDVELEIDPILFGRGIFYNL